MIEFVVDGTPRSLQSSSTGRDQWKGEVRQAARAVVGEGERIDFVDVAVRIVHFCFEWADTAGDLDNIAKPILDAMIGTVFFNDNQVVQLFLRRTALKGRGLTEIVGATPTLAARLDDALASESSRDFVYVSVNDAPIDHGRLG